MYSGLDDEFISFAYSNVGVTKYTYGAKLTDEDVNMISLDDTYFDLSGDKVKFKTK